MKDNGKNEKQKPHFREKVAELLELPKEVVMNIPKLTIVGKGNLFIENYKGIIEYDTGRIRVNTALGIISISGEHMTIKEITSEDIMVDGEIESLEFIR